MLQHTVWSSSRSLQRIVSTFGLVLIWFAWGSVQPAQALFCGSAIVSEGASKPEVLQKCGDPTFAEHRIAYETVYVSPGVPHGLHTRRPGDVRERAPRPVTPERGTLSQSPRAPLRDPTPQTHSAQPPVVLVYPPQPVVIAVSIDEWTYNFGPHNLMYRLRFEDGILRSLKTLQYGY